MNFLSLFDVTHSQIKHLLYIASMIKNDPFSYQDVLKNKSFALLFEKPSLRTRVSFEVGIQRLGGHVIYLDAAMVEPGQRETVEDIAKNLACWTDGIIARVFKHRTLKQLTASNKPVMNALCDVHHPCQTLADLLTLQERYPVDLKVLDIVYTGEGNNVCQSFMVAAAALELKLTVLTPVEYGPSQAFLNQLNAQYPAHKITLEHNPDKVTQADVIYTDTWISMGDTRSEEETIQVFTPYQVNQAFVERLGATTVLHCLPAHRNQEITDEVLDGPLSAVLQQAENRMYVQQAVLYMIFKEKAHG